MRHDNSHALHAMFSSDPHGKGHLGHLENAAELLLYSVDPEFGREGIRETPARVAKAWDFWTKGYREDPAKILAATFGEAQNYDQMICVRDIPVYSKCEHHLADIFGTATVAYIPFNGRVVGLSKLSRLVDCFARRLQMQERMTQQIVDAIEENLKPRGAGVVIKARHLCMESRGICQQGHHTVTTALTGAMLNEPETRAEFLRMAL